MKFRWRNCSNRNYCTAIVAAPKVCVRQHWPDFEAELAKEEAAEVVLQVNGKVRGKIQVPFGTPQPELEKVALADPKLQPFIAGKQIVKVIVVPDKLVNIVVR